jgi:hypothetical protein
MKKRSPPRSREESVRVIVLMSLIDEMRKDRDYEGLRAARIEIGSILGRATAVTNRTPSRGFQP